MCQFVCLFFTRRGRFGPSVYVVAVWKEPNARSRRKAWESVETFGIFLLPVFLDALFGLAGRRVLCVDFCPDVFLLFFIEGLVEGAPFSLIGIERDGKSTSLPTPVRVSDRT